MTGSRHLSVRIARPAADVYGYAADPAHLPQWAAGLAAGVRQVDGEWVADSPMGQVVVRFVPRNDLGVLDHDVLLPDGTTTTNPVRVLPDGDGCEVVFTLRRTSGSDAAAFEADAATVTADLATLKRVLEAG